MTTPPTPQPQPAPLPERVQEIREQHAQTAQRAHERMLESGDVPVKAYYAKMHDVHSIFVGELDDLAAALAAAQAERDALRAALAFYADTENYRGTGVPYLLISTGEVEDDWGTIARDALGGQS